MNNANVCAVCKRQIKGRQNCVVAFHWLSFLLFWRRWRRSGKLSTVKKSNITLFMQPFTPFRLLNFDLLYNASMAIYHLQPKVWQSLCCVSLIFLSFAALAVLWLLEAFLINSRSQRSLANKTKIKPKNKTSKISSCEKKLWNTILVSLALLLTRSELRDIFAWHHKHQNTLLFHIFISR